jgi:hypothetical protein
MQRTWAQGVGAPEHGQPIPPVSGALGVHPLIPVGLQGLQELPEVVDLLQAQHVGAVVQHLAKDEGPPVAPFQREARGGGVQLNGVLMGQAVGQHVVRHDAEAPGRRGGGGSGSGCGSSRSRCRCCCRRCGQACIGLQLSLMSYDTTDYCLCGAWMLQCRRHQQPGTW